MKKFSEYVSPGHPDKVADYISEYIFGFELFKVELDNCNEEDYNWFLTINNLLD